MSPICEAQQCLIYNWVYKQLLKNTAYINKSTWKTIQKMLVNVLKCYKVQTIAMVCHTVNLRGHYVKYLRRYEN